MPTGKVKWFSNVKGYGFIVTDDIDEDLFAHYSAIEMEGYRSLRAGQDVEFEISQGTKGLHAVSIRPAGVPAPAGENPAPAPEAAPPPPPADTRQGESQVREVDYG